MFNKDDYSFLEGKKYLENDIKYEHSNEESIEEILDYLLRRKNVYAKYKEDNSFIHNLMDLIFEY